MRVCKTFTFEAAHRLQNHDGKCRNLHGHSYQVEVAVAADVLIADGPKKGMVLDFGDLSKWWRGVEPSLDHVTILEEGDPLIAALTAVGREGTSLTTFPWPPTAEHLAEWLWKDLNGWLTHVVGTSRYFVQVRVHETAKSWAEAY